MKLLSVLLSALTAPLAGGSLRALLRLIGLLVGTVVVFTVGFQVVMALEGREYTWASSFYWTMVTMTTLGFGDIVFESDLGRLYSVVVLLSGSLLVLILLPFTFIQLVYLPFRAATQNAKAPRQLPEETTGHLLLTGRDPLEEVLIHRAEIAGIPYALIVADIDEAVALHDAGYRVLVGALDDPDTYRAARVAQAALVVTARSDQLNTNVAFTVREVTERSVVVATANAADSVDVLELAGADRVVQLGQLLGRAFAERILAPTAHSRVIARFDDVMIAEASVAWTPLAGQALSELDLRGRFGVATIAVWSRGRLTLAGPDVRLEDSSILLLAGRQEQIDAYDRAYTAPAASGPSADPQDPQVTDEAQATNNTGNHTDQHVVILGGGRVGRATAAALTEAGIEHRVVDRLAERIGHLDTAVIGDAADRTVLEAAGIDRASAVVITTHDDDTNVYLTLYVRRLRPRVEVLARVNAERNLTTMHRAGADMVLSYASTGAMEAWNALRGNTTLLLAEGLVLFRAPVPDSLVGRTLADADLTGRTGCLLVGIAGGGHCSTELSPDTVLPLGADLILVGDAAAEERFLGGSAERRHRRWGRRARSVRRARRHAATGHAGTGHDTTGRDTTRDRPRV